MPVNTKLSSVEYWDSVLAAAKLPRINNASTYLYKVTMEYVDPFLKNKEYKTFCEVGCGSSGWLPYFARKYGFLVSGIDYSEIGCKLAEENLRLFNIEYGDIYCKDLFDKDCTNGNSYDVIFSYGVIEHFEKPYDVIEKFKIFLNPGGIIITLVPNLNGFMGSMFRYFVRENYEIHKVITKEELKDYHERNQLSNLKTDYAGTFSLGVLPWIRSKRWLLKEHTFQGKTTLLFIKIIDKVITSIFRLLQLNKPTKTFSPYVISICQYKQD
jgi:2-polyprenyl-3-methyl-5-hydroxy-6-metoxy-1,4-benzoquinol methylase